MAAQLSLGVENAKINLQKGIAEAQLYMEKVRSVTELGRQAQNVIANVGANIMGSYLTAGQINISVSEQASCARSTSVSQSYNTSEEVGEKTLMTYNRNYDCDC